VTPGKIRALQIAVTGAGVAIAVALLAWPWWRIGRGLHPAADLEPASHVYAPSEPVACEPGARAGAAGASPSERTRDGVGYLVKTPSNYDARRAHPLIVVYAPHGANRFLSERLVGLTREATAAGFVVAYVDSRPLEPRRLDELGRVASEIAARWCIDEKRIFFTGHSDGGTASTALVALDRAKPRPAAIAPSAAGFRREDLERYACPAPVSVMILHGRNDALFPGYGREAAEWWARCNQCDVTRPAPREDGCVVYPGCRAGGTTLLCEDDGTHFDWPARNPALLGFFGSTTPPSP
jgi:polyhydroxybutyrate depolymerase